jgi:hypothetical protein
LKKKLPAIKKSINERIVESQFMEIAQLIAEGVRQLIPQ